MAGTKVGYAWIECFSLRRESRATLTHPTTAASASLLPYRIEIAQVRRGLALAARHQKAVSAEVVDLLANADQRRAFSAIGLRPVGMRLGLAHVFLVDRPGSRQRVVDDGDFIVQNVRIGLVEIDALL